MYYLERILRSEPTPCCTALQVLCLPCKHYMPFVLSLVTVPTKAFPKLQSQFMLKPSDIIYYESVSVCICMMSSLRCSFAMLCEHLHLTGLR